MRRVSTLGAWCGSSKHEDKEGFQATEGQYTYIRHTYINVAIDQLLGSCPNYTEIYTFNFKFTTEFYNASVT